MNVVIDYRRDRYLSEFSIKTLEDRYLVNGETSPQEAFARAAMRLQMMKLTHKDCMIMLVSYGSCSLLLF